MSSLAVLRRDLVERLGERGEVVVEGSVAGGPRFEESPDLWVVQGPLAVG